MQRATRKETNRTRFAVGGDRINYPGSVATPTAKMLVTKLLFNSTILKKSARFMTINISNFYLNSPLPRPEFIKINSAISQRKSSTNTTSVKKPHQPASYTL